MTRATRIQIATDVVLIVGFMLAITLPVVGDVCGLKVGPELREKRALAAAPVWGKDALFSLPAKFERFYDDHFSFRNLLVLGHNRIRRGLLKVSSESVLIGKDGWLFYRERAIDDFLGLSRLSPAELALWEHTLDDRKTGLATRAARYLLLVAPNQCTVYPEHLPDHIRLHQGATQLDQLTAELRRRPSTPLLDVRPALADAKAKGLVYPPQGTHWTGWGAWVVYRDVCQQLAAWRPVVRCRPASDFTFGRGAKVHELCDLLGVPRPAARYTDSITPATGWHAHPAALTVPPAVASLKLARAFALENDQASGRLLVVGDSFLYQDVGLSALLAEHFRRSVFVLNAPTEDALRQLVAQEQPDVVIEEVVERNLGWLWPPQPGGGSAPITRN
jgi:alginate O-acetyltransferase complex protein AlgJ